MKSLKFLAVILLSGLTVLSSCKKTEEEEDEIFAPETLSGQITSNKTLTSDRVWALNGYVRVMSGATLTIEPGTVIKGDKVSNAALIIERGGMINAAGTASQPIIFTSNRPAGERNIGDWSGIIVCGRAPINQAGGEAQYEGGALGTDVAKYGGGANPIANDNSGVIKYVRIEYAGIAIAQDKEINGLTMAAVGSGTVVENVQVSYGGDDAFEFFGGTVNCKNLIAYRCTDDDFDFEYGYNGRIQYAISIKDPSIYDASASGASNGIESDNGSTVNDQPFNKPMLSNFTFIGPGASANAKHNAGVIFRKGTKFVLRNSIIIDHLKSAVEIATVEAGNHLSSGESEFKNNLVFANQAIFKVSTAGANFPDAAALSTFAGLTANANTTLANAAAADITNTSLSAPNLTLTTTSVAKTGASFTGLTGFDVVTYRGAMDTNNWAAGWANFSPNTTAY
ncbi:MAG TPA: hypothetical protein VF602_00050 [Pedobacter sp.]|jgi:hypothetical protein